MPKTKVITIDAPTLTLDEQPKTELVMVLCDGETYTGLDGCRIVRLTAEQAEEIECGDASEEDFNEGETVLRFESRPGR